MAAVAATRAMTVPGSSESLRCQPCGATFLGQNTTSRMHTPPTSGASRLTSRQCAANTANWLKKSAGIFSIFSPRKSFNCDSPINTAIPFVKPMTMLTGM